MPNAKENSKAASGMRERNLYDPSASAPFKLSRSKIELFLHCARCFYLDRRSGIARPSGPTMSLNTAVDALLKREFDLLRAKGEQHASMQALCIDAVPLFHPALEEWRDNFRGIRVLHKETNFLVTGAIDDLWVDSKGRMIVVDYKATSAERVPSLSGRWSEGYKRQAEVYQWLLRQSGFQVLDTAYFVFVNGDRGRDTFDGKLEFTTHLLPYVGNTSWVEDALKEAHLCLCRSEPPMAHPSCEWCAYRGAARTVEQAA